MVEDNMPAEDADKNSERSDAAAELERDDQGRFVVEDAEPEVELEPEPEPEPEVEAEVELEPEPAPEVELKDDSPKTEVSVAALVYTSRKRNSVSVAVLQDRLAELDYADSRSDLRGWFFDGTKAAIEAWQKDNGLEATGSLDSDELEFLFHGTDVVLVD